MRPIGGELELEQSSYSSYFTDSGRSSLRLFLRSGENAHKKYLLPDFFCEVIEKVFIEESIDYTFYKILDDLTIDIESIQDKEYDVFYVINYFGMYVDVSNVELEEKILLEDNVFMYDFSNRTNAKKWYAFNSFRKITVLADGSLVKTNLDIDEPLILNGVSKFSTVKQHAKDIKYQYIHNNQYTEVEYLREFSEGEKLLDNEQNIHQMSSSSIEKIFSIKTNEEHKVSKQRFEFLLSLFSEKSIFIEPLYYSFFILKVENRDEFRKKMMNKNIFLAIHWPKSSQNNVLYKHIISIPLFSNYTDNEFNYLVKSIKDIL